MTDTWLPENLMRLPALLGLRPSASCMMPAFNSRSLNLPMSASIFSMSSLGAMPCSLLLVALTNTSTFTCGTPY
jgi:hypothetical protein